MSRHLVALRRRISAGEIEQRVCRGTGILGPGGFVRGGGLAGDYLRRARVRLVALGVLFDAESWADVVRESQEIVELTLKGLLRSCAVDPPRTHDVSGVLLAERDRLPEPLVCEAEWLANVSRQMRRDRELAFCGAEDLLPGDFYSRGDAETAREHRER